MDLNIRHFIFLMTFAAGAALFWLKPHHVAIIQKKGVPQVAFFDFEAYGIEESGVEDYLRGEKAQKFGRKMIVYAPRLRRTGERGEETVEARRAVFTENVGVELKNDVRLRRSDGWALKTSYLFYDIRKRLYTSATAPFTITFGRSVIFGKKLRYDQKSGKIWAESIRAKIDERDM